MSRYIDIEPYEKDGWYLQKRYHNSYGEVIKTTPLISIPTAEAKPIKHGVIELTYEEYGELCSFALANEQKHGEWLIDKSGSPMCSKCGTLLDEAQKPSRYCPNCGAKMDGGENG